MQSDNKLAYAYLKREDSDDFEMQKIVITRRIYELGFNLEKIFIEEKQQDDEEKRWPQLELLLNILNEGDCLAVWKLKNCDRGPTLNRKLDSFLHERKVRVLSFLPEGDFLPLSQEKPAKIYSRNHQDQNETNAKVKTRLQEKKANGEHVGRIPYGFRLRGKKGEGLEEAPEEQAIIRRIIAMVEAKESYNHIAKTFNKEEIPTPKSASQWFPSTIRNIYLRKNK